MILSQLNIYII